ncbi:transmembrane protein 230 isoform X2 [Indicator indicator]|uniref:transmembrane protein 230 isoform X2 n=1 Tax=Indicator indicator TaxID=1002788 RepID=UPI0023DF6D61|nr:transmembrane protein 230 isoform X2 [Indicator indicator]
MSTLELFLGSKPSALQWFRLKHKALGGKISLMKKQRCTGRGGKALVSFQPAPCLSSSLLWGFCCSVSGPSCCPGFPGMMPSRTNLSAGIPSSKVKYSKLSSTDDGYIDLQFKKSPPKIPYKAIALAVVLFMIGTFLIIIGALLLAGYISKGN